MKHFKEYQYVLINEKIKNTVSDIIKIIDYRELMATKNKLLNSKLKKIINK